MTSNAKTFRVAYRIPGNPQIYTRGLPRGPRGGYKGIESARRALDRFSATLGNEPGYRQGLVIDVETGAIVLTIAI